MRMATDPEPTTLCASVGVECLKDLFLLLASGGVALASVWTCVRVYRSQTVKRPWQANMLALYFIAGANCFNVVFEADRRLAWAFICQSLLANLYDSQFWYCFIGQHLPRLTAPWVRPLVAAVLALWNAFFLAVFAWALVQAYVLRVEPLCKGGLLTREVVPGRTQR